MKSTRNRNRETEGVCITNNYLFCRLGVVYKEMKLPEEARKNLIKSVHLTPLLWASWYELAKLCETRDMVSYLGEIWGRSGGT